MTETASGGASFGLRAPIAEPGWDELMERVQHAAGDPVAALRLAPDIAAAIPGVGTGRTAASWSRLAAIGALDLTVCRALEPHLDALTILRQARAAGLDAPTAPPGSTWGVYAAEGPAGRLRGTVHGDGTVELHGTKPWCSLAGVVSHALVTAWTGTYERTLCAIRLDAPGVHVRNDPWAARGLSAITSGAIELDGVAGRVVGPPGWYLSRPGFAWGGAGVAACWFGGAAGLVRRLAEQLSSREPDQLGLAALGECDAVLAAAAALLGRTAGDIDRGDLPAPYWRRLRTRTFVCGGG